MSIAIHSQKGTPHAMGVAAMSRRHEAARDTETPERSAEAKAPKGRHALMNALSDALATLGANASPAAASDASDGAGTPTARTPEQKEALHAFVHELFNALRPTPDSTGKGHHGRGFAWGRTSLGDLAERIGALAQKLAGAAAPAAGSASATPAAGDGAPSSTSSGSTPSTSASTSATTPGSTSATTGSSAAPATPNSATTASSAAQAAAAAAGTAATSSSAGTGATTAAPTATAPATSATATPKATTTPASTPTSGESSLLAAFRRLTATLQGSAPDAGAAAASPAEALAALLHRMAQALVPDGRHEPPASGSLIDVTA